MLECARGGSASFLHAVDSYVLDPDHPFAITALAMRRPVESDTSAVPFPVVSVSDSQPRLRAEQQTAGIQEANDLDHADVNPSSDCRIQHDATGMRVVDNEMIHCCLCDP
jgi:hypothetical protein